MPTIEKSDPGVQHLVLGAFGLPMGLGLIIITGADLLTANSCYLSAAVFEVRLHAFSCGVMCHLALLLLVQGSCMLSYTCCKHPTVQDVTLLCASDHVACGALASTTSVYECTAKTINRCN